MPFELPASFAEYGLQCTATDRERTAGRRSARITVSGTGTSSVAIVMAESNS